MYVLTDKNGENVNTITMLPSAFFTLQEQENGRYEIMGGGLGHGIGMSQYGADGMARAGKTEAESCSIFPWNRAFFWKNSRAERKGKCKGSMANRRKNLLKWIKSGNLSNCKHMRTVHFVHQRGETMDYKHLIRFFLAKLKKDNIGAYAAQAALFIIMSAIPFLLVFLSLLRFTPVSESTVLSVIQMVVPGRIKITPMLINIVDEVYTNSAKVLPIAVIFAIYSAAKSIQSLRYGLNIVYDTDETRNWFVLRFRAMIETFVLILVIILLMVFLVFGQKIQNMLVQYAPILSIVTDIILKLRLLILFFCADHIFYVYL